jgi:myo-inositol-1(or 4)-monophosphatase
LTLPSEDGGRSEDAALLTEAVREAGALGLTYFRQGLTGRIKADNSPVSEADLAVNELLHDRLRAARPAYGWLSEETADDPARLEAERVWIVDPIDGTRTFLAGEPRWTVAVALVENGRAVLGAVFAPAQSEFYFARDGGGASVNGVPIRISAQDGIEGSRVITAPRMLKSDKWAEPWPTVQPIWVQSMTYRLAMIASGQADATLALSAQSEWDLAAAILLVEEAGGRATDAAGRPLRFNQANPRINGLVAAGPGLHELLVARTRPVALDN